MTKSSTFIKIQKKKSPVLHLHSLTLFTEMHNWVPTELQSVHLRGEGVVVVCVSHLVPVNPSRVFYKTTLPFQSFGYFPIKQFSL